MAEGWTRLCCVVIAAQPQEVMLGLGLKLGLGLGLGLDIVIVDERGLVAISLLLVLHPKPCRGEPRSRLDRDCARVGIHRRHLRAQEITVRLYVLSYIRILLIVALITANLCIIALLYLRCSSLLTPL